MSNMAEIYVPYSFSPFSNNGLIFIRGKKLPLFELWDPTSYAKGLRGSLANLCLV